MHHSDNRPRNQGFTLLEVMIVMMIGGLILGGLGAAFSAYMKQTKFNSTKDRLETIQSAIQDYVNVNNKLPCPASMIEPPETDDFGREVNTNCSSGAGAGTTRVTGRGGEMVRIGAVPVRSLNLPDQYLLDGWQGRFIYAVPESMATSGTYNFNGGAVSVIDSAGHSVIVPEDYAHYVIASVGPDNVGTTSLDGRQTVSCDTSALDGENCDGDATFRKTLITSDLDDNRHFDDVVVYQTATKNEYDIPSGAVMAFNLGSCPPGWNNFAPANGRAVVGMGSYNESYNAPGRSPWSYTKDYALGESGGYATWVMNADELPPHTHKVPMEAGAFEGISPSSPPSRKSFHEDAAEDIGKVTGSTGNAAPVENRPPYIALLYCVKS